MPGSPTKVRRAWYHPLRLLQRLMLYVVVGYVLICALLYAMQNRLIYIGAGERLSWDVAVESAARAGFVPWKSAADASPCGLVQRDFSSPTPRGTIVLLHGNGEYALHHEDDALLFRTLGFRTLLYEYPGYGGRPGRPSEKVIVPEVRAAVRALDAEGLGPVYLWGQSLGSGVAAAACADPTLPVRGLLLLVPFDSLPSVAQAQYPIIPVYWLMTDRYNSGANLAHFTRPVCVCRADHDALVPANSTLRLYDHLPGPKKMIVFINCGHNTWPGDTPESWLTDALDFVAPK